MLKHKNNIDMNKEDFKILKEYLEQLKIDTGLNREEAGYLKAMNDLEHLIIPDSSLKLREIDTLSFGAWVNKYYRYCLDGYIDLETQEFKSEKQLLKIYKDNDLNP